MAGIKNYIIKVKSKDVLDTLISDVIGLGIKIDHVYRRVFYGFSANLTGLYLKTLKNDPRISEIEESVDIYAYIKQTDAPWHLDRIDQRVLPLSGAYTYDSDGTGVIAYVLDSGCVFFNNDKAPSDTGNFNHIEFGGRVSPIHKLDGLGLPIPNVAFDPIYDRLQIIDPDNNRLSSPRGFDHFGHGTHVAGIIGSETYGVAKNVSIRTAKVIDVYGAGITSDVVAGIEAILADYQYNTTPGQRAICNMSLGTPAPVNPAPSGSFEVAVQALVDSGITVIVAAGNEGQDANNISPARMSSVITVGATARSFNQQGITIGDVIANFSNFGNNEDIDADQNWGFIESTATNIGSVVDIFAPGASITSTYNSSPTAVNTFSGTSMASPMVAGVAVLALENNISLTPALVRSEIINNSVVGIISDVPGSTPNRMLFSIFVDHEIQWITPAGNLGNFAEGYVLNPIVDLDAIGVSGYPITFSNPGGGLPTGVTINPVTGVLEGVAPPVLIDTVYNFIIRASDASGYIDRSFSLTIKDGNLPPKWLTSPNLSTIEEGEILNIQLSAVSRLIPPTLGITYSIIDINTNLPSILPYGWTLSASGLLSGDVPIVVNNNYSVAFKVRAHDGVLFTDRVFTLTIAQSSFTAPPVWQTSTNLGTIVRFNPISIQLLATDADGQPRPIKYKLTVITGDGSILGANNILPQGLILNENTGEITGSFIGNITDGLVVNFTNFDNNTTTFDNNTTTLENNLAIFEFQIFATDGADVIGKTFTLTILNVTENIPIEWITPSSNLGSIRALTFGSFEIEAFDPDNSPIPIKYTLVSGVLPTSMFLNSNTGVISGVPSNINEKEKISIFGVRATDGISIITRTFAITVLRVNRQPEWDTPPGALFPYSINEGELFSFQLRATDPNGNDILRYRVIDIVSSPVQLDNNTTTFDGDTTTITDNIDLDSMLPDGLTLNSLTGVIFGQIDNISETTTFEFTVRVDDSISNDEEALFSDRQFSITVVDGALNINNAPIWSTLAGALTDGIENEHYRYELLATDFDGPNPLKFILIAGNLPQGLTLNTTSGVISGYPSDTDTVDTTSFFTIRAFDGVKSTDRTFSIKIIDSTIGNLPPVWITPSGSVGTFNELSFMIFALQATDPEGDNVTYTDSTNSLPSGIVVTLSGIINGFAPQVSSNQVFNFTIDAHDEHGGVSSQVFSMTINDVANMSPIWSTAPTLGTFPEGAFTPIVLLAIDPDTGPSPSLTYTNTSGSITHIVPFGYNVGLPPGLSLSSSGIISGFSTVTGDADFSFEVTVSDGAASVPQTFALTITEVAVLSSDNSSLIVHLTGDNRHEFKSWNTLDLIYNSELFAPENPDFGRNLEPDIYVMNNIHTLNPLDITTVFGVHHDTFNALVGIPTYAVVRDINGNVMYEVIYVNIIDPQAGSSENIIDDYLNRDNPLILPDETVSYNFAHLRSELQALPNSEQLPAWMTAEQIFGDSSSVIGYTPSLVLAYVKPGHGNIIIDRLNFIESHIDAIPANETTFDVTVVFGDIFNPTITISGDLTIKNGLTASIETVTFTAPRTLLQIVQDINDAAIDGVTAVVRTIEMFVPDIPATTWPGTFQVGQVLAITYDQKIIEFGGTALSDLGLPIIGQETKWNDGSTFDNSPGSILVIDKGTGYQFTGRKLTIDRYLFNDNTTVVTSETSFDGGTLILDGNITSFDQVIGVQKWIKFTSDLDYPAWITQKGILGGYDTGDAVSIQLESENKSGSPISYSLTYGALPDGIILDSNGLISGTILGSLMISNYFVVRAIDAIGKSSDRGFVILVDNPTTFDNDLTTFDGDTMTLDVV